MPSQDLLGIDNIVSKLKATNADIEYAAVIGLDKRIIAHSDLERRGETYRSTPSTIIKERDGTIVSEVTSPSENYFEVMTQIVFNGKQYRHGYDEMRINKSVLLAAQNDVNKKIAAEFVLYWY